MMISTPSDAHRRRRYDRGMFNTGLSARSISRFSIAIFAAVALLLMAVSARAQNSPDSVIEGMVENATASGEHIWLLIRDAESEDDSKNAKSSEEVEQPFQIFYHGPAMQLAVFSPMGRLTTAPDDIVAVGNTLYVFVAREDPASGIDVYSMAVVHNEAFDVYFSQPRDRMELHQPLPGCKIVALADHDGIVTALIVPLDDQTDQTDQTDKDNQSDGEADSSENDKAVTEPQLLELRSGGWEPMQLPEEYDHTAPAMLGSEGPAGRQLLLLQAVINDSAATSLFRTTDGRQWTTDTVSLNINTVHDLIRAGGQATIVQQPNTTSDVAIGYLRQSSIIELATIKQPAEQWLAFGSQAGIHVISRSDDGAQQITSIDLITGKQSEAQKLRVHQSKSARIWFIALLLAGSISIALLIVLIRPAPKQELKLPKGVALMPPMQRLLSLLIDAFPAAVITLLITRSSIAELLQAPLVTPQLIMSYQYMILIGLTLLHSTISEAATGTTLGKVMLGGKIITLDGDRPGLVSCLLRAFGKALTLLVLPIAVFGLLNRNFQGVDDLLGRTLVVQETDEEPKADDNDR